MRDFGELFIGAGHVLYGDKVIGTSHTTQLR